MKTVILCEKPNVAGKVKKAITEPGVVVVAARGHLIELGFAGEGGEWTYPIITLPDQLDVRPIENARSVLDNITKVCKDADVLVSATDLDREGSSIFLEIYKYLSDKLGKDFNPELKRMEVSSLTDKEIKSAWSNLKEYDWGRSYAGFTRNLQDMQWGINITRALTLSTHNFLGLLSGGRVQTPMLKIIVDRDRKIEVFNPEPYWNLNVEFEANIDGQLKRFKLMYDGKIKDKDTLEDIKKSINVGDKVSVSVADKTQTHSPPPPFNGTSLQIEGNRALGFTAKEIADRQSGIAQKLYEAGLISYPGTDSEKYPNDWGKPELDEFKAFLKGMLGCDLPRDKPVEGKKEDAAHPCMRVVAPFNDDLGKKESKLYDLIMRRNAAGFGAPAIDSVKTIIAKIDGHKFKGSGKAVKDKGWREIYPFIQTKEKEMPNVANGDEVRICSKAAEKKETRAPPRINTIGLIAQCEKLGLGTKNTRPGIIEKLSERGYVTSKKDGKKTVLQATDDAKRVIDVLDKHVGMITSETLTKMFNEAMDTIEDEHEQFDDVNIRMLTELEELLLYFKKNERSIGFEITDMDMEHPVKCPDCGAEMRVRRSKDGKYKFFGCSKYPDCKRSLFFQTDELIRFGLDCGCGLPVVSGKLVTRKKAELEYIRCIDDKCQKSPIRCKRCDGPVYVSRSKKSGEMYSRCPKCNEFNMFNIDFERVTKSD